MLDDRRRASPACLSVLIHTYKIYTTDTLTPTLTHPPTQGGGNGSKKRPAPSASASGSGPGLEITLEKMQHYIDLLRRAEEYKASRGFVCVCGGGGEGCV